MPLPAPAGERIFRPLPSAFFPPCSLPRIKAYRPKPCFRLSKKASFLLRAWPVLVLPALLGLSCDGLDALPVGWKGDLQPPQLLKWEQPDFQSLRLDFSEVLAFSPYVKVDAIAVLQAEIKERSLHLRLAPAKAGVPYVLNGIVQDQAGNQLDFLLRFYGVNPRPAGLIFSAFNPKGSVKNPEIIELAVIQEGNTAGITLFQGGGPRSYQQQLIFPDREVSKGDVVVVLTRTAPEKGAQETSGKPGWWLPAPGWEGLGDTRGVLSLYQQPDGKLIDGLVYSAKSANTGGGWHSKALQEQVAELASQQGWHFSNDQLNPEEAIPLGLTATANIKIRRKEDGTTWVDSNQASDWFVEGSKKLGGASGGSNGGTSGAGKNQKNDEDKPARNSANDPPTSAPPASSPPVNDPPNSAPPAGSPPVNDPPKSAPPASSPPVNDPPNSAPPASSPPVNDPPNSAPPASSPPVNDGAQLLISEFNPEGNERYPEIIELAVVMGGSTAGITLYLGSSPERHHQRFELPVIAVSAGDYIIVHTRRDESEQGVVNETLRRDQSQARLTHDRAWDFWAEGWQGLSSTRGLITLYRGGQLLDGLVYSAKTAKNSGGWHVAELRAQVQQLASLGGWQFSSQLATTEAIQTQHGAPTRSINRRYLRQENASIRFQDHNNASDWYIGDTGSISPGELNSSREYRPSSH